MTLRARRLKQALDSYADRDAPVAGVGHSIGTTMLLALAGGTVWMGPGQPLNITRDARLERLVLLAPATAYFQAPGALDGVKTPVLAWAGAQDVVTPPAQAEFLRSVLGTRLSVEVRIAADAGHFSFMNVPPPQLPEPLPDKDAFLRNLTTEVCSFITG